MEATNKAEPELFLESLFDRDSNTILEQSFRRTLDRLRESFHAKGGVTSRNEILDDISVLLTSHLLSMENGGAGLHAVEMGSGSAKRIISFVDEGLQRSSSSAQSAMFREGMPTLHISKSADGFADEIISAFSELSDHSLTKKYTGVAGRDVLNEVFGKFLASAFQDEKEFGQYLTPNEIVHLMVEIGTHYLPDEHLNALLGCAEGPIRGTILDPSCGTGSFLSEALRRLYRRIERERGTEAAADWLEAKGKSLVVGIDKSNRMARLAAANLALFGVDDAALINDNALRPEGSAQAIDELRDKVSLILTNPPFGAEFRGADLDGYRLSEEWSSRRPTSVNSECLFIERYMDWLAPGGVVCAIVPDSVLFNKGLYADLRRNLKKEATIECCISLPPVTFASAGTTTKTSILCLKKGRSENDEHSTLFGVANTVGFEVTTSKGQRLRKFTGVSDLPKMLRAVTDASAADKEPRVELVSAKQIVDRWDANFYAGMPVEIRKKIRDDRASLLPLTEVCSLIADRVNPKAFDGESFDYIEISSIDNTSNQVTSSLVRYIEAPSRARRVVKSGDILVSLVRPDRKTMGIVPPALDGAICSTGLAILRLSTFDVHPRAVLALLKTDFVTHQIIRSNVGISYPAVDESALMELQLPCSMEALKNLTSEAAEIDEVRSQLDELEAQFELQVSKAIH